MPNQPTQPTVLVKKSDGTTVRMTLAELQSSHQVYHKAKVQTTDYRLQTTDDKPQTNGLQTTEVKPKTVVSSPKSVVPSSKPWKTDDVASMLDEAVDDKHVESSKRIKPDNTASDSANLVLDKLGWRVGEDARARLQSLIVSRLKDIRTDEQFLASATAPTYRGGAGLSADQAQSLHQALMEFLPKKSLSAQSARLQTRPTSPASELAGGRATDHRSQTTPTSGGAMVRTVTYDSKKSEKSTVRHEPQDMGYPPSDIRRPISEAAKPRALIHDIIAPAASSSTRSTGPVEELASFTLKDFQRSTDTAAAVSRLKSKFDLCKQESYLLFLDARDAWYKSPFYRQYIDNLASALAKHDVLKNVLARPEAGGFTLEMAGAIVELNKYI